MKIIRPELIRRPQQADILFIPAELTYQIFLLCYEHNPQTFPKTISQTCHVWREFALTCPVLWSSIVFDENLKHAQVVNTYKTQLERSGEAPLVIHICASAVQRPVIKNMRTISDLIIPRVSRWKSLEIDPDVPHKAIRVFFDKLRDARAPLLEKLTIHQAVSSWDKDQKIKWRFKAFGGGTPKLRQLTLGRAKVEWQSNVFRVNTLDHLTIRDGSLKNKDPIKIASSIRDVLAHAPGLRYISVKVDFGWGGAKSTRGPLPLTPDPFTHSAIETLDISMHRGTVTDYLLHSVRMPSLRALEKYHAILPFTLHPILHFNPLPHLQEFRIHNRDEKLPLRQHERQALPFILQSMKALQKLFFSSIDLTGSDSWLHELLIWCPSLIGLHFTRCEGVEKRALKEMVERRRQAKGPSLQQLSIVGGNGASDDFGRLVEEGEIINWIRLRVDRLLLG